MGSVEPFFVSGRALPAIPELARQLMASHDDEGMGLADLVALIANDPFVANKLRAFVVRSGVSGPDTNPSLIEAASRLGIARLRNAALVLAIAQCLPKPEQVDLPALWSQCLATAGYAQWLSRVLGLDPDRGYLAGFLLRTGQLFMAQTMPQIVASIEANCSAQPGSRPALERRWLGFSHGTVTAELARRWHLPVRLIDGVAHADNPIGPHPFSGLAAVLCLAATLADAGQHRVPIQTALSELHSPLLARLRLDALWLASNAPQFADMERGFDLLPD